MRRLAALLALLGLFTPAADAAARCLIAIDIGHSRDTPGATSARGVPEWQFNAALARRLDDTLAARGVPRLVINPAGDPLDLASRPRLAAAAGATLLLSIHHDSMQPQYLEHWQYDGRELAYGDRFSGYGLFVSAENADLQESLRVARDAGDGLLAGGMRPSLHHAEPIAGENRPLLDTARGIYRFDGLAVLRRATMAAVLVEAGIIVNRADEVQLARDDTRDIVAGALADAAAAHCTRRAGR